MNCPIPGCTNHTRPGELLCIPHWRQVPSKLKSDVWSTWRAFTKGATAQAKLAARKPYLEARQAAIDAIAKAESPLV
jgi:hypothetical protein